MERLITEAKHSTLQPIACSSSMDMTCNTGQAAEQNVSRQPENAGVKRGVVIYVVSETLQVYVYHV